MSHEDIQDFIAFRLLFICDKEQKSPFRYLATFVSRLRMIWRNFIVSGLRILWSWKTIKSQMLVFTLSLGMTGMSGWKVHLIHQQSHRMRPPKSGKSESKNDETNSNINMRNWGCSVFTHMRNHRKIIQMSELLFSKFCGDANMNLMLFD